MSVRNLDRLFRPRSVALIGASPRPNSVGGVVARNLRRAGFAGELMLVKPASPDDRGQRVHPNVASLPHAPDLAVIVTSPETVPRLIGELGQLGTRAAVVIAAAFGELGEEGRSSQRATLEGGKAAPPADRRELFTQAHIATYETPDDAVIGFLHRVRHRASQELLIEAPPARLDAFEPDLGTAKHVIATALAGGKSWLEPPETAALLRSLRSSARRRLPGRGSGSGRRGRY